MEKISEYREIARMLKDGKTVVKKTRITKERCLEDVYKRQQLNW